MALPESILFSKTGHIIPKDVIGQVSKNATASMSSVRIVDGNFKIFAKPEELDVNVFMNVQDKAMRNLDVLYHLSPNKVSEDKLQPTILIEDDGDALLVCFHDGDVDIDKFQTLVDLHYGQCGEDLEKMLKILDGPAVRAEVKTLAKGRYHITLMAVTGEMLTLRDNPLYREHDWGWGSNLFEPPAKPETATSGVPKLSAAERVARNKAKASKGNDDVDFTKKAEPGGTPQPGATPAAAPGTGPQPGTDTALPGTAGQEELVTLGPPPKHLPNSGKRSWWMSKLGYTPPGYKTAVVTVPKSKLLKPGEAHVPAKIEDAGTVLGESVVEVNGTVLDPKIIDMVKAEFAKAKVTVQTAVEREAFRKKFPFFVAQTGIPLEDTQAWDFEKVRELCVKIPLAAAVLLYEVIEDNADKQADLDELLDKEPVKKPETRPLTAAEKVARNKALAASGKAA